MSLGCLGIEAQMNDIEWRPVVGYEGYYEVSNRGDVRSLTRTVPHGNHFSTRKGKQLKVILENTGYYSVRLCKHGTRKKKYVHRLVAEAFIPNHEKLESVDHINFDRTDNRVENLRWLSLQDNTLHSFRAGRSGNEKPVLRSDGKWFRSGAEAARSLGGVQQGVSNVINGYIPSYKGYTFTIA